MREDVNWDTVTSGVRVMIPVLGLGACLMGLGLVLQPAARFSSPAYVGPKELFPMHVWGWLFFVVSLLQFSGMVAQRRRMVAVAVSAGGTLFACWAGFIFDSAVQSPTVSWTTVVIISMVVAAHTAVLYSLVRDTVELSVRVKDWWWRRWWRHLRGVR